jgi:hypothetical protein
VLEELARKAWAFERFREKHFYIFSKSGFTPGLRERAAAQGNVRLVGLADMFG